MNDQISRQKLIESIKKWQKEAEPEEARVMEDIICLINDQPPADQWIPCSSGVLPTEKGYYWVTEGWGEGKVGFIHYSPKYNGTFEALMKIYDLEITAWMPANLPEPYKGVE